MSEENSSHVSDTFAVEKVEDDVFGTDGIVSSFGYESEEGIKEVYIEDVDEEVGTVKYSLRGFGQTVSREQYGTVDHRKADDPEEIIDSILNDSGDQWQFNGSDLTGSDTAQTYRR